MHSSKKIIVETMKKLYSNKFISVRDGNISFKPKNENFFYISAGSIRKNELNEDQVIKVNFKRKDLIFKNEYDHDLIYDKSYKYLPSREIYMHSYLLTHKQNKDNDTYIVHAHPPNITSFIGIKQSNELSTIKEYFPEINVGAIGENVKYHEAGSKNLASDCFNKLINNEIVGLERHGTLSIGNDIDRIIENIETLEYYIQIYMNCQLIPIVDK